MAFKPEDIWVVRHTYDKKAKQWVNVIRNVTKDEKYKSTGTDPYGNQYHDDPVDFKRDWDLIYKLGYSIPVSEFRKFAEAAFGFGADKEKEALYVKGAEYRQLGQLIAKRASMEASTLKPGKEKDRRIGLAAAMATGSDSYAEALKRNAPSGWDKAHAAADRYKLLGEIEGMIGQRPGADTQLPTLTPLLVGYIRHAKPEEIQQLSNKANVGDLDGILSQVGAAAEQWKQDPAMQQYPFASAANRYNSPTHAMDVAAQYDQGKLADVDQPQTYNPTYENPNAVPGQKGGQYGQQENPEENPSDRPQGEPNTGSRWTAPQAQQYRPAQKQPESKPGDFGGSLGSMATNMGGLQRQPMFPYPRDPGVPPKISDYGAFLAAPTNQAALAQAMNEYQDVVKFYQVQARLGLVNPRIAEAAITQAKDAYDAVHRQLIADESVWKERLLKKQVYKPAEDTTRLNITRKAPVSGGREAGGGYTTNWERDLARLDRNATPEEKIELWKSGIDTFKGRFGSHEKKESEEATLARAKTAPDHLQTIGSEMNEILFSWGMNAYADDTSAVEILEVATSDEDLPNKDRFLELARQYQIWSNVHDMMMDSYPEYMTIADANKVSGAPEGPGSKKAGFKRWQQLKRKYEHYQKPGVKLITGPAHHALRKAFEQKHYAEFGITNHNQWLRYLDTGEYPKKYGLEEYVKRGGPRN